MREASETRPYASDKVYLNYPLRSVWSHEKYEGEMANGVNGFKVPKSTRSYWNGRNNLNQLLSKSLSFICHSPAHLNLTTSLALAYFLPCVTLIKYLSFPSAISRYSGIQFHAL